MDRYAHLTLREAQAAFFAAHGMPAQGAYTVRRWAPLHFLNVYLPNFAWRRRAIAHHDLHHVLTQYACTPAGEMEMAAWEFAAGRFPDRLATLFCLPLVGFGAVAFPKRTFAAFVRGRRSATLYSCALNGQLLDRRMSALRRVVLPSTPPQPTWRDRIAYGSLVSASLALVLSPVAFGAVVYFCCSLAFN